MKNFPEHITYRNTYWYLLKLQRDEKTAVYRTEEGGVFLRMGDASVLRFQYEHQKEFRDAGAPVPEIISFEQEGETAFLQEASLGSAHFGELFEKEGGENHFGEFVDIVLRFLKAQYTLTRHTTADDIATALLLPELCEDFPELAPSITKKFSEHYRRLRGYPIVLSHGDFNPHNMYPTGVIDFENVFAAPFGYDAITALYHVRLFPVSGAEFCAAYTFTDTDKKSFLASVDTVAHERGVPPLSQNRSSFFFLRLIWSAARMGAFPKLQEFRKRMLIRALSSD